MRLIYRQRFDQCGLLQVSTPEEDPIGQNVYILQF